MSATFSWQANLLDPTLVTRSARNIAAPMLPALVAGLLLVGIVGFTQSSRSGLNDLRARAELAEQRQKDGERRLAAGSGESLEARRQATEAIEAELAGRRVLLGSLQSSLSTDSNGWTLSGVLTTLSEQHRDGLWLTRIAVDRLRREVSLEGRAGEAQTVSDYVASLGQGSSALARMAVRQVETERDAPPAADAGKPSAPRLLKFKLLSQGARP